MRFPIINSNLGPILPRFRDIAGFRRRATPPDLIRTSDLIFFNFGALTNFLHYVTLPLFHPNFRGVPFGLDFRCCGSRSEDPKLIIRVINFELVQPICSGYINVTDERTNRQTDDLR